MIDMAGPPVSYYSAKRLAFFFHQVDKLAVVFFDDYGHVTIKEIQKIEEVEKALNDLVRSRYSLGGRKWRNFNVRLVGSSR